MRSFALSNLMQWVPLDAIDPISTTPVYFSTPSASGSKCPLCCLGRVTFMRRWWWRWRSTLLLNWFRQRKIQFFKELGLDALPSVLSEMIRWSGFTFNWVCVCMCVPFRVCVLAKDLPWEVACLWSVLPSLLSNLCRRWCVRWRWAGWTNTRVSEVPSSFELRRVRECWSHKSIHLSRSIFSNTMTLFTSTRCSEWITYLSLTTSAFQQLAN